MFDSDKLENKAMTNKTIFVTNTGKATINGLPPGKSMPLRCNRIGKPLDQTWRRLTRRRSPKAVLQISDSDPGHVETMRARKKADERTAAKAKATKPTKKGD